MFSYCIWKLGSTLFWPPWLLIRNLLLPLSRFFYLTFRLKSMIMMYLGRDLFGIILFSLPSASKICLNVWYGEIFSHLFSSNTFLNPCLSSFLCASDDTKLDLSLQSHRSLRSSAFLCQSVSSLLLTRSSLYFSVFKFTDSFLCPFYSPGEPIHWVFYFIYYIF